MKTLKLAMCAIFCAAGFVHAEEMAAGEGEASSDKMSKPVRHQAPASIKRLPKGDLRYCLEMKTNEDIIRCAETRRKK